MVDLDVSTPSGDLLTVDLNTKNGDERFLWSFDGEQVGATMEVGCLDLVCPDESLCESYDLLPLLYDDTNSFADCGISELEIAYLVYEFKCEL